MMTDPFSISVGVLAVLGAGAKAVEVSHALHSNYRDAGDQVLHAQLQHVLLKENIQLLAKTNTSTSSTAQIQSSLAQIEKDFPSFPTSSRRSKLLWALKNKNKVDEELHRLKETEISAILALLLHLP